MKFFFGTTNPYKIRELAAILRPLGVELEITDPIDPEETGDTFEANAIIKAEAYGKHVDDKLVKELVASRQCSPEEARNFLRMSQVLVICEDSGIALPALEGLPGPWSARFDDCVLDGHRIVDHKKSDRTRDEIDLANNLRVLELISGIEQPYRAAEFVVAFAIADIDGNILFATTNKITGWVAEEMKGSQGFGYDPIFANSNSFGKTWAEIDPMRKNLFSHRRKALQEFTMWLAGKLKAV